MIDQRSLRTLQHWFGKPPPHWGVVPNRAVFREVGPKGFPDEPMLSVTIQAGVIEQASLLRDSSKKDQSNLDRSAYRLVEPGDLAYNKMRAWQGALGVSTHRGIVSPAYIVMRPRGEVEPAYYHYLFRSLAFAREAERWSYGITSDQWSLRSEDFKQIYTLVPPLSEQRAIARFLDRKSRRIARFIHARQQMIVLLNEQKQAIIHQAVTRGLDPDVPLKPSGIDWLGAIPAHWEIVRLTTLCSNIGNGWVGPTRDILATSGTPYLQSLHIKNNNIAFKKPYYVREEWLANHEKARVRTGDVLIVQTGDIGQVATVGPEWAGSGCHALIIARPKEDGIGEYLSLVLNSSYGQKSLKAIQTGALHPHLNCGAVREIPIPIPSTEARTMIMAHLSRELDSTSVRMDLIQREMELVREYRTRLIADVVTGKLDVRHHPDAAEDAPDDLDELSDIDVALGTTDEGDESIEPDHEAPE